MLRSDPARQVLRPRALSGPLRAERGVYAGEGAFAAVKENGKVVAWEIAEMGGCTARPAPRELRGRRSVEACHAVFPHTSDEPRTAYT